VTFVDGARTAEMPQWRHPVFIAIWKDEL